MCIALYSVHNTIKVHQPGFVTNFFDSLPDWQVGLLGRNAVIGHFWGVGILNCEEILGWHMLFVPFES
jgi:hypothetical protein